MPALLFCFAHPDDETFATGGTIARYATLGTALVCATRGEAGRVTAMPGASREDVGRVREGELRGAAAALGAGDVELLGYADGGLARSDTDALVGDLVRAVRRHRPRVVVTFGPEGAPTGHRDHRAISRAATAAFLLAARASEYPDQLREGLAPHAAARLYYVTWPDPPLDQPNRHEGVPASARIDTRGTHDVELRAFMAHRSQRDSLDAFRRQCLTTTEDFALITGSAQPSPMVDDLFAGLTPGIGYRLSGTR